MTRQEIESTYTITERLTIANPGKFEGEPRYVPYFWDAFLNGCADEDDGEILRFYVSPEDAKEFPELIGCAYVELCENDQGFVMDITDHHDARGH